jgi:S1-C subfamily serine protease
MPEYGGRQRSGFGRFLVYAAVAVLAAGAGAAAAVALNHNSGSPTGISSQDVPAPKNNSGNNGSNSGNSGTSSGTLNSQAIASKVDPGIVDVTSTLKYNNETAEGTGMVLSSDGLVLTNNHVINNATNVRVTLVESSKTYSAKVVGYDSADDVALLQLSGASGLKTVSVGNSSSIKVGDKVLALGNAQGRGGLPSTAAGSITALHKTITAGDSSSSVLTETLHDMLQTDAPIQEGDSGGPLANASGEVVGMDTAANTSASSQFNQSTSTTGFAIPIDNALTIARQIASGKATSTVHIGLAGFMGVGVADISQANTCVQNNSGIGGGGTGGGYTAPVSSGAVVCSTYPGTPAATSGLRAGDVITAVNGQTVGSESALTKVTNATHPGDKISIAYVDTSGARHTTTFSMLEIAK